MGEREITFLVRPFGPKNGLALVLKPGMTITRIPGLQLQLADDAFELPGLEYHG